MVGGKTTVQPIRDLAKIEAIKKLLASNPRDYMLFVMGINSGLRVSDLLSLKINDVVDSKGRTCDCIRLREQKTGKEKQFPINKNAGKAIKGYLDSLDSYEMDDYLFKSREGNNKPITRMTAWTILGNAAQTVGITDNIGTHTLRKTFGYHAYQQGTDIALLQQIFNHSAPSITLRYIGITQDDIDNVYININL